MDTNNPTKIIGVGLPMSNSPNGYFNPTYYSSDQIKANLKNLILTQKGLRVMDPDFGTLLSSLLFLNADQLIGSKIINIILKSIET